MRTTILRRCLTLIFSVALALTNSSCFLQTISGATFAIGSDLITTVQTDSILATCVNGGSGGGNVTCTYFFLDENGVPVSVTSSADLISEFGILGVVIDPLIYQIPDDAINITGTYEDEFGNNGDLVILSGYRSIPIDIQRILIAEPGTKFVIAELPDGIAFDGIQFTFTLSFMQSETSATSAVVKPMLSVKFSGDGKVFYPPFLPCEHNMADVPAYVIEQSTALQPIEVAAPPNPCNNEFYPLIGFGVVNCDFDADNDVDSDDIAIVSSVRNSPALPGDRLDANSDGIIDLNDARRCALQCLNPNCAIDPPRDPAIIGPALIDVSTYQAPKHGVKP